MKTYTSNNLKTKQSFLQMIKMNLAALSKLMLSMAITYLKCG